MRAQAIGDGQALGSHELPFLRIELSAGAGAAGIAALAGRSRELTRRHPSPPPRTRSRRTSTSGCRRRRRSSLFGATGDLAARKLLPAIYDLLADGRLPERFRLLAVVRGQPHERLPRPRARRDRRARAPPARRAVLGRCSSRASAIVAGHFDDAGVYDALAARSTSCDEEDGEPLQPRSSTSPIAPAFFAASSRSSATPGSTATQTRRGPRA